jgi:hypothetical protein
MPRLLSCLSALLLCAPLSAQSAANAPPAAQFQISGTTRQCGKPVPRRWWVRFDGNPPLTSKTVKTDNNGVYETDLPFGAWTMTLRSAPDDTTEFARARQFQVSASGRLVFDIYLRPPIACSVRGTSEQRAGACWGEQFFEVPTAAGVPLEIDLFGLYQYENPCGAVEAKSRHREFATYNLLSIEADHVAYHPSEKILEAGGDVLMQDESGEHKADSVAFKIQDGQAIQLGDTPWQGPIVLVYLRPRPCSSAR